MPVKVIHRIDDEVLEELAAQYHAYRTMITAAEEERVKARDAIVERMGRKRRIRVPGWDLQRVKLIVPRIDVDRLKEVIDIEPFQYITEVKQLRVDRHP